MILTQQDNVVDILRLIRTPNIGDITFFELIKQFGSAANAVANLPNFIGRTWGRRTKKPFNLCPKDVVEKEIELCQNLGIHIITYQDSNYPLLLKKIDSKPPVIFAKGNLKLLNKLSIAVVGSRKASLNGAAFTYKIVKELTEMNIIILSGMALGIDTCAHKVALSTGTIAFLGSGINVPFPLQNKELYHNIIKQGLVLSAVPVNGSPIAINFPKRNNYMAGMSMGTLIIEARLDSGSLITANCALNFGREVFAVPGNPNDLHSQGCNKLIKEGAILVEDIQDMASYINNWRNNLQDFKEEQYLIQHNNLVTNLDEAAMKELEQLTEQLLPLLSFTPISIDIVKHQFNNHPLIPLAILELEILGTIERLPGNKIKLTNNEINEYIN